MNDRSGRQRPCYHLGHQGSPGTNAHGLKLGTVWDWTGGGGGGTGCPMAIRTMTEARTILMSRPSDSMEDAARVGECALIDIVSFPAPPHFRNA